FYTYFSHQLDTLVTDTERLCSTVIGAKRESWDNA
ncbi:MAG: MotA/TolQ/ExbB proton channel family protein, partial [Negativicutes bacterium]